MKKLQQFFTEEVKNQRSPNTPGTPSFRITRPGPDDPVIDATQQKRYRSGVGMLLYLVKHSRPDIANAVRELSKSLDRSTPAAYKEMLRVVKYVLDTPTLGLKIFPQGDFQKKLWKLLVLSDADWAGDPDNRVSVTGYIIYLNGIPFSWKSKAQKSISLSSSESEWYALSEACKEVKFIVQTMISIGITVELPVIVKCDNLGAIFTAENHGATSRMKHVSIRTCFVKDMVKDKFIKIIFVKSAENDADVFTKNVSYEILRRFRDNFVIAKEMISNPGVVNGQGGYQNGHYTTPGKSTKDNANRHKRSNGRKDKGDIISNVADNPADNVRGDVNKGLTI